MTDKAQSVRSRLVQLERLLLMLLLAVPLIPRAAAQRNSAGGLPGASCEECCLWNQYDNAATEPPISIGSQKFEPAMAALDDQAADDFVFVGNTAHCITGVQVMGDYSVTGGPASSFNIYFYQNGAGNLPTYQIAAFENLPYTGMAPDFVICLPSPFCVGSGTYWLSVQANQDLNPSGQWFWHNRTVQRNAGAVWQNPGDGYGTGCIAWNRKIGCMLDQIWPDQVFKIFGFNEGPLPTPKPLPTPRPRPTPAPRPQ